MKSFIKQQTAALIAVLVLSLTGCVTSPTGNQKSTSAPTAAASPSPSATPELATNQLTLPVLDALLNDQSFLSALKSQLSLSDEQIASLKSVAAADVERLRKSNAENSDEDATQVRLEAERKIDGIIGQEKTRPLAALVNEHWAKSEDAAANGPGMSDKPSAVPTDTRIIVNIPAFRMDLFDDGQLVKTYKIGIGYPAFPLPQGLRKAQSIIINPTWTPPDSPWVDSTKVSPGETVEAGSKLNPLGPVKIPIGMPSLIHGGKATAKLGGFASHGCVGLTNAQVKDFAARLAEASDTRVPPTLLDSYYKEKTRTRVVKLNQPVPVELRYQTIVVENGAVHIYKDVYAENTNTKEKLDEVLNAFDVKFDSLSSEEKDQLTKGLQLMSRGSSTAKPSPDLTDTKTKKPKEKKLQNSKEIVVPIGLLADKGYPQPVELDTGSGVSKLAAVMKPVGQKDRR